MNYCGGQVNKMLERVGYYICQPPFLYGTAMKLTHRGQNRNHFTVKNWEKYTGIFGGGGKMPSYFTMF